MTAVDELQEAALAVAERIGPATVAIGQDHRGTGVVIGDGRVLTNVHNLRDRTTQITFADGTSAQGEVVGADPDGDLVVLAVDGVPTTPAEWSPAGPTVGQVVFAAARGRHGLRVTFGLVSGTGRAFRGPRGRRIAGSVEHTAPLARGSSGGPLLDAEGRLVGLNTRRLGEGFYLAIPADAELVERVNKLAAGESPTRRRLGIAVAPAYVARRLRRAVGLPERDGLLVRSVDDGSPAAHAGLASGDLIVSADGHEIRNADDLWEVLDGLGEADHVTLGIVRGADDLTVGVTFANGVGATEEGSA
jgi:S1-C subfamily serine protease